MNYLCQATANPFVHAEKNAPEMIKNKIERLPLVDAAAFEILSLPNDPRSNYDHIIPKISKVSGRHPSSLRLRRAKQKPALL